MAAGCTWITRASVDTTGGDPNATSFDASISGDGRYVAFHSLASDLVPGDGNGLGDVFVRDLQANTTTRASVDSTGGDADHVSSFPSLSDDGRYVAFQSLALTELRGR
jgi:Tol biopolymer transport system component